MRILRHKLSGEWRVTEQGVRQFVKGVYIEGTEKSLTTSATTAQAAWITFQLVWYLVTQIV